MAAPPIIVICTKKALSYEAKGRSKYQLALAEAAPHVVSTPLASSHLYAKVYYFHRGKRGIDAATLASQWSTP